MRDIHLKSEYIQHFDRRSPSVAAGEDALKVIRPVERLGARSARCKNIAPGSRY